MQQISSIFGWQHRQLQQLWAAPAGSPGSQVARPNGGRNLWKIQGKKVPLIIVDSGFQNSPSNLFPPNFQTSPWPKKEKIPRQKKWENGLLPFLRDVPLCTLCVLGCPQQGEKGSSFTGIQRISWYGPYLPGIFIHLKPQPLLQNALQHFWTISFGWYFPPCSWMNLAISWNLPLNPADSSQLW